LEERLNEIYSISKQKIEKMKKEKELEVSSYNFGPPFLPKKGQKIGP
jgi:hypothetical protein